MSGKYDLSRDMHIRWMEKQMAEKDAEISKLKADIQCMVNKAARKYLPRYREMGVKLAEKDTEIERLKLEVLNGH